MKRACLALSALLLTLAGSLFATKTPQCWADKPHTDVNAIGSPVGGLDDSPLGNCHVAPAIDDFGYEPISAEPGMATDANLAADATPPREDSHDIAYDFGYACEYGCLGAGFAAESQLASDATNGPYDYRSTHDLEYDQAVYGKPEEAATQTAGLEIANRANEAYDDYAYETDGYDDEENSNYEAGGEYNDEERSGYESNPEYEYGDEYGYGYDDEYGYEMESAAAANEDTTTEDTTTEDTTTEDTTTEDTTTEDTNEEYETHHNTYDEEYSYDYSADYGDELKSNDEAAVEDSWENDSQYEDNIDDYADEYDYDGYDYEDGYEYYSDDYDASASNNSPPATDADICNDYLTDGNETPEVGPADVQQQQIDDASYDYEYGYEYDYESQRSPESNAGLTEKEPLEQTYDEYDAYGYDYEYGFEYDGSAFLSGLNKAPAVSNNARAAVAVLDAVANSVQEIQAPTPWENVWRVGQAIGGMLASKTVHTEFQEVLGEMAQREMEEQRLQNSPCDWNGPGSWHAAAYENLPPTNDLQRRDAQAVAAGAGALADLLRLAADQLDHLATEATSVADSRRSVAR